MSVFAERGDAMKYGFNESYKIRGIRSIGENDNDTRVVYALVELADDGDDARDMDMFAWFELMSDLDDPCLKEMWIYGSDPFDNLRLSGDIAVMTKCMRPDVSVVMETSRDIGEILKNNDMKRVLKWVDLVIDGGASYVDVKKTLECGSVCLAEEDLWK